MFRERIVDTEDAKMSVASLIETGIVVSRRFGRDMTLPLKELVDALGIDVVPLTEPHYAAAMRAWHLFGKGRSPAKLNFGDCLSYATAYLEGMPLLYKGNDFPRTDIDSC